METLFDIRRDHEELTEVVSITSSHCGFVVEVMDSSSPRTFFGESADMVSALNIAVSSMRIALNDDFADDLMTLPRALTTNVGLLGFAVEA